jgi:hypothetical protein
VYSDETLPGYTYRQSDLPAAPIIFSFVASVDQLERWCGVPRRIDDVGTGFQRTFEEGRVKKIQKFFSVRENCSPTAIAVGFRSDPRIKLLAPDGSDLDSTSIGVTPRPAILRLEASLLDDLPQTVVDAEGVAWPADDAAVQALRARLTHLLQPGVSEESGEASDDPDGQGAVSIPQAPLVQESPGAHED